MQDVSVGVIHMQRRGPSAWKHTHRLTLVANGTEIYDQVRYRLLFGPLGTLVRRLFRPGLAGANLRLPRRAGAWAAQSSARRAASSNGVSSSGMSSRIRSSLAIVGLRKPSTRGRATEALTGVTRSSQSEER
jgi:hypothetical protein